MGEEKGGPGRLTIDRIYTGEEFKEKSYSAAWLPDGSAWTTLEDSKSAEKGKDIVRHDPRSGATEVLVSAADLVPSLESGPLKIEEYRFSDHLDRLLIFTNGRRVWRRNTRGDYWMLDRSSGELRQLGKKFPASTLMFAKLHPSEPLAAYVQDRNLYLEDLHSGEITALTASTGEHEINGTFDWVHEEELDLRDGFRWSPDGRRIAFWRLDTTGVRRFPLVNNTEGLYPGLTWIQYPKTGQQNSASRIGVIDLAAKQTTWLEIPGDPRQHYLARMEWAESSEEVLIQQLNRLQNTNRVFLANAATGQATVILEETDEAWVDLHNELIWLHEGRSFLWVSERDGWRHVYRVSRDGTDVKPITHGQFDVVKLLKADESRGVIYLIASPENATQRYLYRCPLDGGTPQRLTPAKQPGVHAYALSPKKDLGLHRWSSFDTPPQEELIDLDAHQSLRVLENQQELWQKVLKLDRKPVEFFQVEIGNGLSADAWCIKPPDFDESKRYPLLVYVYGEPAGQTVQDHWNGKTYLWHQMLAQRGYVIMSFDNRGTPAPRGRSWRKCIYRNVGVFHPEDQARAVRSVLRDRPYLDAERVGIWGWSGGGSSALHAMFRFPDLYKVGISIAPVPNQRYYDTIYQERYMGLPTDNVEGYRKGSAIHYAGQLQGQLLLIHGTGDDNCHYQGTELLIDELIRQNKQFSLMAYPNRSHSISEGTNISRHLRQLMTDFLTRHLPPTHTHRMK